MAADPEVFMPAVRMVRNWLAEIMPPVAGFVIEDKNFGVALHYRSAEPGQAQEICILLREFVARQAPPLVIREGKMVIEAVHPQAHKGAAVRTLLSASNEHRLPVYFGDDITDEDAFYALREEGVTVQVCAQPSATWARYRVGSPKDVIAALAEMASAAGPDQA
jgi:trehalose-phosphatase